MTVYIDDFNKADSGTIGNLLSWTQFSGFQNASNKAHCVSVTLDLARADSDLSTSNNYAKAIVTTDNFSNGLGMLARYSASEDTAYLFYCNATSVSLYKRVSSTNTIIAGPNAYVVNSGDTIEIRANGSTITGLVNGVSRVTATDTAITTGTRGGIFGSAFTDSTSFFDSFEMGDLGGEPAIPFLLGQELM